MSRKPYSSAYEDQAMAMAGFVKAKSTRFTRLRCDLIAKIALLLMITLLASDGEAQRRFSDRNGAPGMQQGEERESEYWNELQRDQVPEFDQIPTYFSKYAQASIYDPILAVYNVKATRTDDSSTDSIKLDGEVSFRWYKSGTERMLRRLGFNVVSNNIKVLPDDTLPGEHYALATSHSATMRKAPVMNAEQVNVLPLGWPMRLLRASTPEDAAANTGRRSGRRERDQSTTYTGQWWMAQSSEGYVGFVRDDQIGRASSYKLPDAVLTTATSARQTDGQDIHLPAGAGLYADNEGAAGANVWRVPLEGTAGKKWDWVKVSIDPGLLRKSDTISSETILQLAAPVMGTPYLWGGVTESGIDCSGFTQYIYKMLGVYLPRDARPQSVVGAISAFGEEVETHAKAGDLVYFADESGRISHIGIALGGGMVVHSSGGQGVHICDYHEVSRSRPNGMLERILYSRQVLR